MVNQTLNHLVKSVQRALSAEGFIPEGATTIHRTARIFKYTFSPL